MCNVTVLIIALSIYSSYDVRSGDASHWKNVLVLGRASYLPHSKKLLLDPVTPQDAATFTCRVDFRISPTLTYFVNLTVISKNYLHYVRQLIFGNQQCII